jgi:hypothetical protein
LVVLAFAMLLFAACFCCVVAIAIRSAEFPAIRRIHEILMQQERRGWRLLNFPPAQLNGRFISSDPLLSFTTIDTVAALHNNRSNHQSRPLEKSYG